MSYIWQSIPPALYKQIQADEILTLPSSKYVKNITSALRQTFAGAMPLLIDHLLNECEVKFILTGHIQSDFIESRFGWYRQLCGANYYNSVLQFLQAEKPIRVRSFVKMGFPLKNIKTLFSVKET